MDSELALLSRMVQTGRVQEVVAAGIEPRHFSDPEYRAIYETCVEHFRTWRVPASVEAVNKRHSDFQIMPVTDDVGYLISEFRADCAYKAGLTKWRDLGNVLDQAEQGDPDARNKLAEHFLEHAREMASLVPMPRSSRMSDMVSRVLRVKREQELGVQPGVRIGIPQLDPWIGTVRDTEFAVHCGYSGRGKSTGLVRSTAQAYAEDDDCLFFSLEMEEDEIWEIFDAQAASLSRQALRKRELSTDDYDRYMRAAERVAERKNEIVVIDDTDGAPTIDKLAALVERFGPKTVAVDYVSLMAAHMRTQADWERVTLISRALKQLARTFKIKVYAAAQNNREAADDGPTEDNIAFSNAIYQDCNIMVGYHQDPEMEKVRKMQVRLIKQRNGPKGPIGQSGYGEFFEMWDRDRMNFEDWSKQHEWEIKITSDE